MKLLYIVNQINGTSGQERIIVLKTDYFIKHYNFEIVIITIDEINVSPFFNLNHQVKKYNIGPKKNFCGTISKYKEINNIIKKESPSVVIVVIDNIAGLYLPYFLNNKFPMIYERHNSKRVNYSQGPKTIPNTIINFIKKILLKLGGHNYKKVVLLSNDHVEEWKNLNNLAVIANPLIFYPDNQAKLVNKKVLAIGRHSYQKGFDMLLKSWAIVIKTHKDWTLNIYGKQDNELSCLALAEHYGIKDYVNFNEPVTDIMDVYLESSIFALSSRFEGLPLVLIETMSCGVPAVAFNCPYGVKDLITDKEDGILVEANDINDFANSLIILMENPKLRKQKGNHARKNILRLSAENIFPKWKSLFEELIVE